ncbi:MAG: lipoprotein [Butyrivibrio sp.]|nr:lipoprotein [Butyrivibrio sp.]
MRGKRIVSIITAVVLLAGCSSAKNMSSEELTQID